MIMEERTKKITIRFTEKEYQDLVNRAERNSMQLSAYVRGALLTNQNENVSWSENDTGNTMDYRKKLRYQISNDLTQLQYYIEKLPGECKEEVSKMKGSVNHIWHLLK